MTRSTRMSKKVEQYLQLRRGLGYKLQTEGKLLQQFAAFADAADHRGPLTTELALRWARLPADGDRLYWARRLEVVRCFARHLVITEPDTQVPPRGLLGPAHRRTTPYIYSDAEMAALVAAARGLAPSDALRPRTYATLLGTLACTGLRISEALRLTLPDVDLERGVLKIRETKFRKTRWVPPHPTAIAALETYAADRHRMIGKAPADHFFVSQAGRPLPYSTVRTVFRKLCRSLKIMGNGERQPRLHDMRHTFACRCIERWYTESVDLHHAVSALSVYLGHAKVSDTYWYLTATPGLMARAAARFETYALEEDAL
jgi:integrase